MPILYSVVGTWMYSNRRIFDNKVFPKIYANGPELNHHTYSYTFFNFTPGTPLIALLIIASISFHLLINDSKGNKLTQNFSDKMRVLIKELRVAKLENFFDHIKSDD